MRLSSKITKAFKNYIEEDKYDIIDLEAYIQKEMMKELCPLRKDCFNLKQLAKIR